MQPLHRAEMLAVFGGLLVPLAACSGGGGDNPSMAVNRPPAFSSPASATVNENAAGNVVTVAATDPDGDPVTFAIIPGGDAALFNLDGLTGVLSLPAGLDFESPQDANGDNIYALTIEARDNRGGASLQTVAVSVLNVGEGMVLRRVGAGFAQPLYLAGIPGTNRVVVVEKGGRIRGLDPETGVIDSVDFLDLSAEVSTVSEQGLLGLAFSPGFESDRTFYVNLTNLTGDTEIRRYRMFTGSSSQADPSTADVILSFPQPFNNHNSGWLGFAGDGLLFVPTGDGGSGGDPLNNAQNTGSLLGKVLRLDLSADDFPADPNRDYRIPPGNAFPGGIGGLPEIFALGLRNPFRASFDPATGDLFLADVGQNAVEEINRLAQGDAGANFGWNAREGTQPYNGGLDSPAFTPPVAEYLHGTGPSEGNSITGGYVYRGPIEPIRDRYVFADFVSGNVWALHVSALTAGSTAAASEFERLNPSLVPDAGTLAQISSFGMDTQNRLYVIAIGGDVFRFEAAP